MRSNIKTWQNSFFNSRLPKHKTQYVKFQTFVSLYLDLMVILLNGASVQLGFYDSAMKYVSGLDGSCDM